MSSKPPSCLIILTGLPKSNKSLVAKDILRRLLDAGEECVLVDEHSLSLKRNKAYKDAQMEKITRQTLQSTVERYVRPNGPHVILDSMNLVLVMREPYSVVLKILNSCLFMRSGISYGYS